MSGIPLVSSDSHRLVGVVVFYGDDTVRAIPEAALSTSTAALAAWAALPGEGVQIVVAFEARTFDHWSGQDYAPDGRSLPLVWIVGEHYKTVYARVDYYWMDAAGAVGGGQAAQVPDALPLGAVKAGVWMDDDAFRALEGQAHALRRMP